MGYYESPHTNYYDKDLHELLVMYDNLTKTYDSLLHDIRGLGFRLDDYLRQVDAKIPGAVQGAIKKYEQELDKYRKECENNYQNMVRIVETFGSRTDKRFDGLEKEITGWHQHLEAHEKMLYKVISQLQSELSETTIAWSDQFKEFTELVDLRMDAWRIFARGLDLENREWTERLVDELSDRVSEIVSNDSVMVWNAYRGDYTSLQLFIDDLWNRVLPVPWGYTCKEWDSDTEVTCEVWDKHEDMTCIDWYIKGKLVFHWKERKERINSWVSGKKVYWREAIREIYPLLFKLIGSITAGAYDGWEVTAEEYEQYRIMAKDYDSGEARRELWKE